MMLNNIDLKRNLKESVTIIYIITTLIYIFIQNILCVYSQTDVIYLSLGIAVFGFLGFLIYIINKFYYKMCIDFYDKLMILLIIFGLISTVFAINRYDSIFGTYGRYEGFLQIFSYYMLFLNCKNLNNKNYKKIILNIILSICLFQAIYGIFQFYGVKKIFGIQILKYYYYSMGLVGNPNFFGSLMVIFFSLTISIFLFNANPNLRIYFFIMVLISFLGLLTSGAMSAIVAIFFLILFLFFIFVALKYNIKKNVIKFILAIVASGVVVIVFNLKDNNYLVSQTKKTTYEISQVAQGEFNDHFGTGRIYIWKEILKITPKNIITGVGIDNLHYAFGENPLIDLKSGGYVDKAHNEYLQKLITEGIFSFLTYFILIFSIFMSSLKKMFNDKDSKNYLFISLFLCFVSYSIQAFFNISVIYVAPIYYIVMGLLVSELKEV